MDKPTLLLKIDELRKKYVATIDPVDKKIIAIRGKLLKKVLKIKENSEPPQKNIWD